MSSPLIKIPLKTTTEADYAGPIRQTIATTYQESPDSYRDEIDQLSRARRDAMANASSLSTTRDLLYRYFGQIELLDLRFPNLKVSYTWNDAFNPTKAVTQMSLAYEKASTIFTLAATLSALAVEQNRSNSDGLKRAFQNFRSASGLFAYLNDNFLHAPSADLSRDLVKAIVTLMTCQATEVFLERMQEEKRSSGLMSKICAQAANLYAGLENDIKEWVTKGTLDRTWLVIVQTKAKYFSSLAQYNRALADLSSSKQGDALGRLILADTLAKEAVRLSLTYGGSFYINPAASANATLPSDAGTALQDLVRNHSTVVAEARSNTQKDNDLIYHVLVPSESALPAIDKAASIADPISIQDIFNTPEVRKLVGQDIFIKLVPLSVIESSSMYSEEKAKILRMQGEECEIADVELRAGIESLGLPSSLTKFKGASSEGLSSMADPGSSVRGWSSEIRAEESTQRLEAIIGELSSLRDRAKVDLDYCSRELDNEQRECEQARVKYDHHFEQSPSGSHTRSWRTDLKNDREALTQASQSDDQVLRLWATVRDDIHILASGDDALDGMFAEAITKVEHSRTANGSNGSSLLDLDDNINDGEAEEMNRKINAIEQGLDKLSKLKKERADVLADLKERVHNDDISQLLILNRKSQNIEPTLFASELEKFRAHQARIGSTIAAQQATFANIQQLYSSLSSGKKGRDISTKYAAVDRAKKDLTGRLKKAYDGYREIRSGVGKGTEFYRELGGIVGSLRQEVAQFVDARSKERSSMISGAEMKQRLSGRENSLDTSFDSMSLGGSTRSPPPPSQPPSRSAYPSLSTSTSSQSFHSASPSTYAPYAAPPLPQPSYSAYASPTSSTPSLPPKPSTRPQNTQYRQPSSSGLPPPPQASQPQYRPPPQHQSSVPPPPNAPSYSYGSAPPPPASYSSPPPSQYNGQSYGQPAAPPRPPPHQPSYSGYGAPSPAPSQPPHSAYGGQPSYSQQPPSSSQGQYGQYGQPSQPQAGYGQQPQQGGYNAQPPPPPQHPQHQYGQQYGQQPQPGQYRY